ncbi:uncharacterized protein E0L32_005523 [Thyridium curvatum]|uniref:Uncharacterized protein n=1 Tax=Thyridium curvatum TaxID=1093900 RepID=A0A507B3K1_9PEZI|nr:uncharacterized protein E0L32_005523 [Thyridium curvatum]TPX14327.1 hypothetical protein E0L32_005523 [Thyridium curvatum]
MAGLQHFKMALDPAIVRLGNMTTNRHKYFRWTGRTAGITFVYVAVVPSIFYWITVSTQDKWDLRAKRRGDLVAA